MATPTLDRFLKETENILRQKDGQKLQQYLILEPPYPDIYQGMIRELRQVYLPHKEKQLEDKLEDILTEYEGDSGGAWNSFRVFLMEWLKFIVNVDVSNLLKTHQDLKIIMGKSQAALGDNTMGVVVLPTVIFYAQTLAKFTMFLENQPDLLQKARQQMQASGSNNSMGGGDDEEGQSGLASDTAGVIIEALKKCINDRSAAANGGISADGRPAGRRVGIYVLANVCLKLLTRARQFRSAETIFRLVKHYSPPLSRFRAAERVTYLYYLGRYHFSNSHFLRAQRALQGAYDMTPPRFARQRAQILVHLIAANLIVGRLPSRDLLARPEAQPLARHFLPLAKAVRTGDVPTFRQATDLDDIGSGGSTARFFFVHGILLQLQNRCEVLVMRSLARRVFQLTGFHGSAETKAAPNLDIPVLRAAVVRLEERAVADARRRDPDSLDMNTFVDPEFDGLDDDDLNYLPYAVYEDDADAFDDEEGDENGEEGGGGISSSGGLDGAGVRSIPARASPTLLDVEMMTASLVRQGLLHGFISHKHAKFVVSGARNRDASAAGFPRVWDVMREKRETYCVGWVTDENRGQTRLGGVVRLSGVQAVGVAS